MVRGAGKTTVQWACTAQGSVLLRPIYHENQDQFQNWSYNAYMPSCFLKSKARWCYGPSFWLGRADSVVSEGKCQCHGGRTPYKNQAGLVCDQGGGPLSTPSPRRVVSHDLEIQLNKPEFHIYDRTAPYLARNKLGSLDQAPYINQSRPQPQTS